MAAETTRGLRLAVKGALPVGEESSHHRGLGARVDISGCITVILHVRTQQTVQSGAGAQQVLELVEYDERLDAIALEQPHRQVEQLCRRRQRGLLRWLTLSRTEGDSDASGAQVQAEPCAQRSQVTSYSRIW